MNLLNIPNAFVVPTSQPSTTIPIALGSTRIKQKWLNMFSLVIDALNKNTKVVMEMIDRIYFVQLEIEECYMKIRNA
jgi:hypothetical protein